MILPLRLVSAHCVRPLLLAVCAALLFSAPSPAAAVETERAPAAERTAAANRDRVADRTLVAVNNRRYGVARRTASPRAARELRSFRERGFQFFGRARNDCYASSGGTWQCPGTVRKNTRLRGSVFLDVRRAGPNDRWRVVQATVVLGE